MLLYLGIFALGVRTRESSIEMGKDEEGRDELGGLAFGGDVGRGRSKLGGYCVPVTHFELLLHCDGRVRRTIRQAARWQSSEERIAADRAKQ